jgi:hypothetical protein
MMSVGDHSLQIVNDALGYRQSRTVQVQPGRGESDADRPPEGIRGAECPSPGRSLGGTAIVLGETPIGNVTLPIGGHDVLFRHPELGEQRHTVTVTLNGPAKLSVDMRKRQ